MTRSAVAAALSVLVLSLPAYPEGMSGSSAVAAQDSLGRMIQLPSPASRIVCLSPGAAEILYSIGAGSSMTADSPACDYPSRALLLPKVDAAGASAVEGILAFRPELVVAEGERKGLAEALSNRGAAVFVYGPKDVPSIPRAIMSLGELVDREDQAVRLAATITEGARRLRLVTDAIPTVDRIRVLWLASAEPPEAYTGATLAMSILDCIGARNALAGESGGVRPISAEEARRLAPRAILVASGGLESRNWKRLSATPGWDAVPAVGSGLVFPAPEDILTRGGPRIVAGLLELARRLYPDRF